MQPGKKILLILLAITNGMFAQNRNAELFEKIDLTHAELKSVKLLYDAGDYEQALSDLITYYRSKDNLYLQRTKEDVKRIKKRYPTSVKKSIKTADEVLDHYFLFRNDWDMEKTNIPYVFEGEIDWKAMPNGDPEWCFMLNRHKYWIDLGKAYLLTGDEKYARGFVKQVTHWIENNPLQDEFKNYSWRRIEAGLRCENWIKAYEFLKNSKYLTPDFMALFLNSLYEHGQYINSSFSNFSKTSNWGVIEYQGLFNLACFMPEFTIANQWKQDAIDKLTTCIGLQIMNDGTQWEQSPMYHNEVFHCYLNVNLLAQRLTFDLPEVVVQKTLDMAYANVKWQKPNYHQPLLGDSDDTDLRGILCTAGVLFSDSVLKSRAFETVDYETYLIASDQQLLIYNNLEAELPEFTSLYQQSSGDLYMRSSWSDTAYYSSLHLKKLGCGHGHDNILHLSLYANQRDYLIDGGRYTYVDNEWREFFKSSFSHNTLGVDRQPNSIYESSWVNSFEARSQGDFTLIMPTFDYGEAENTAYKRLDDPVSVKRRVFYLKPNIWVIFDSFQAHKEHVYSQYFNFPNDLVQIIDGGITTNYNDKNLRIQPLKNMEIKLEESWYSPEYNLMKENVRAELFQRAKGFTSFISVLYFPEQTTLNYELIPVYSRKGLLISDDVAEAVSVTIDNIKYTLLVVHDSPVPASHFLMINEHLVQGEVVLLKEAAGETSIQIIKE